MARGRIAAAALCAAACAAGAAAFEFCDEAPAVLAIGSSTVYPVTELAARKYEDESVIVVPRSTGSSLGIRNLLAGGAQVGAASRPIKASDYEKVDCDPALIGDGGEVLGECQGVLPVPVQVGSDLLALVVNPANTWATDMTLDQVAQIFSGTSTWADVFPGGPAQVPNLLIPDVLSGTYDFFVEASGIEPGVVGGFSDDSDIIAGIASDPNALGFTGLAFVLDNPAVKVASLEGVDPTVTEDPTSYAFFRPLFTYLDGNSGDAAAANFVCSLLGEEGQRIVSDVGYVPLSADQVAAGQDAAGCSASTGAGNPDGDVYAYPVEQFLFCKDMAEIIMIGSSTVYPISSLAQATNPNTWLYPLSASVGSSVGIATFLAGGADIGAASRAMKASDYESFECDGALVVDGQANGPCQGRFPKGALIGRDTLAIIANPSAGITDISSDDLVSTFSTQGDLTLCVPDIQSGTRDFFEDEVTAVADGVLGYTSDEDLLECIRSNPNSIGFVGYAYVPDDVTVVTVDGVDPAVDQDSYPLVRPLFYYYDAAPSAHDRQVMNWVCKFLTPAGQDIVAQTGYVPLTEEEMSATRQALNLPCTIGASVAL